MADNSKKYLVKIDSKCNFNLKDDIKDVFGYCAELNEVTKGNTYVTYISETEKRVTLLFEFKGAEKEKTKLCESDVIIYQQDNKPKGFEKYIPIEILSPTIREDGHDKEITKDEFIKYIIPFLSEYCEVGLMQGYEASIRHENKKKYGEDTNKSGDTEDNDEESKDDVTKLQNVKYIICDYGDADTGKSNTLKKVINILENSKYVKVIKKEPIDVVDEYAQFTVNGKVNVSVCMQGDPKSDHPHKLVESINAGMDVIVCAARDDRNGAMNEKTVNQVYDPDNIKLPNGTAQYIKIWTRNFFIAQGDSGRGNKTIEDIMCITSAKGIVELIERLMGVKIL